MRKLKTTIIVITLLVITVLGINSCNSVLDVPKITEQRNLKLVSGKVQLSLIETGSAKTLKAFAYKGGSLFKGQHISHVSVWIKHAKGDFLFDTGLGDNIDTQFEEMSGMHKMMFKYEKGKSVKTQLLANGIAPSSIKTIILSHLHWDHASGINDFPNAEVFTTSEELEFAKSDNAHSPAFLKSQYTSAETKWRFLKFKKERYEFFEESCDYYGDGSVVFVKLPGHTLGSVGMFVNADKRYFFTGDVTWATEAFKRPSSKNSIPGKLVDHDKKELDKTIIKIHQLMKADSNLIVVPAHDFESQKGIKHYPEFQN